MKIKGVLNSRDTILYFWESAGGKLPCATQLDFLDILFIPGMLAKCGQWQDSFNLNSSHNFVLGIFDNISVFRTDIYLFQSVEFG